MDLHGNYYSIVKIQNYSIKNIDKEIIDDNDSEIITYL